MPVEIDKGEAAAISLASLLKTEVLLDESRARVVASILQIPYKGTLYVLLKALKKNLINFEEFLGDMKKLAEENFYLGDKMYMEIVNKAREIFKGK